MRNLWKDLRAGIRVTDARYGPMAYFKHDEWHGRSLREYGEWSESEVSLWRQILFPGARVIDIGAHIGAHTRALRALVGRKGEVNAYEFQPKVVELLRRNTADFDNVHIHAVALGDGKNDVMMYNEPDYRRPGNFGGVNLFTFSATMGQGTVVRKLDDLGAFRVHFIKIDVEGMEREVLEGARRTIIVNQPVLYVEADRADKAHGVVSWLQSAGYFVRFHIAPLFNVNNFRKNPRNIFEKAASINVLATLPKHGAWMWEDKNLYPTDMIRFTDEGICLKK